MPVPVTPQNRRRKAPQKRREGAGTQKADPMEKALDTPKEFNVLSEQIIGCAIQVHKTLGPGFGEKMYAKALAHEFKKSRLSFIQEAPVRVKYDGVFVGMQRLDFTVADKIVLEVKAVYDLNNFHMAQVLSYLKATGKRLGLLLNFSRSRLQIKRVANHL